ncbi:MAG TPA: hypothetical protein V6C76_00430 [Drouetiella sp.]
MNNGSSESHHHGFLFFGGHHNHNTMENAQGASSVAGGGLQNVSTIPGSTGAQNVNALSGMQEHHGGFLFFGHHHHNSMEDANGNPVAYSHHHHSNYSNFNSNVYSSQLPPSGMVINMATPPAVQPVPINLSVAKYFYNSTPRIYYNPARYYNSYTNYNPGYFGSYGSNYSGYGYSPTGGMTYLFFRLLSLIGMGPSYYGYGSTAGYGYSPNAFLGTWGPASSLAGPDMDQNANATNFVNNYDNFNYAGGPVAPFANMGPANGTADDGTTHNFYDQNGDPQIGQDPNLQGLSATSAGSLDAQQNLTAMLGPNAAPGYQNFGQQNYSQSIDSADSNSIQSGDSANEPPPFNQIAPQTYGYHNRGVLGSAFVHSRELPKGSYQAPELLGIVFTHQFWNQQNESQTDDNDQTDSMTAQN